MLRKHHTRARMLAIFGPGRGPAWRDAPDDTGDANPGGGDGGKTDDGGDAGDGIKPKIEGDLDKDRAARALAAARAGETKAKDRAAAAEKKHQDALDGIAVALGLKPDPKTDPTALVSQAAKERDDAQATAHAKTVELAVYKTAGKAGGDADALLDSRGFLARIKELDAADKDFNDLVVEAIKAAVKDNPKLGATASTAGQGPGRQGADITGSGGGGNSRSANLDDAVKRKLSGS